MEMRSFNPQILSKYIKKTILKTLLTLFYTENMKYVKSTDEEYVLDDGENIMYIRGKLEEAKKEALKAAEKGKKVVTISKTIGFVEPDM